MVEHAAITIVSKNYLAFAETLAKSYKKHHPENDFIIVLVDRADGRVSERLDCGAEVVEIADLRIPDISRFIYRYSIMELNTAVKPYALADLMEQRGYQTVLYIDPDIWIFEPLDEIYSALDSASVVLIPHIRRPFFDDKNPSDLSILQSGTYNLGFIGLRRGVTSKALLDWWMEKLYLDCVVDIPKGLFVDQKWIDLVPGFFPDHKIIHHLGYNAAYWNLHERPLTREGEQWRVGGSSLVFFHFSGYVPYAPTILSKHQNRHDLNHLPQLKALTDAYGRALIDNGYEESYLLPYAFERLPNGTCLPLEIVTQVMQWCMRSNVRSPCPITESDAFCRFLMSRNVVPGRPAVILLFHVLLQIRSDVLAAFPNAAHDSGDSGFRAWIRSSGVHEHQLSDLLPFEQRDTVHGHVSDLFRRVRSSPAAPVLDRYKGMWRDRKEFDAFVEWVRDEGPTGAGLTPEHGRRLSAAAGGVVRILHIYFLRGDLQVAFQALSDPVQVQLLVNWLREFRFELELTEDEITVFFEFATSSGELLEQMRLLYQHRGQTTRAEPNIYVIDIRRYDIASTLPTQRALAWLQNEPAITAADHYRARFGEDNAVLEDFSRGLVPNLAPSQSFEFVKRLRVELRSIASNPPVNLAGFMQAPTGMGESARSMHRTLESAGSALRCVTLPSPHVLGGEIPISPALFGWPAARPATTVTVANADSTDLLETFLPKSYWGRRNIGYWVWETEELPQRFRRSQRLFDEIWTPSNYSAAAIARTVDIPVRVLPHVLPLEQLDAARPSRASFGLPQDGILFGFAFDPASVIERKNVRGLLAAYRAAMRRADNSYLVIKVNGRARDSYEYGMIRAAADTERILFIDASLDRAQTYDLLASLDVYVSLHRSEGFGLTCAEAMALGVPVIATGYSGNLDFMDTQNSLLVPARVVETDRPFGPYPPGTRWGDPDIEIAAYHMRALLDCGVREGLGEIGRCSVRERLNSRRVGGRASSLLSLSGQEGAGLVDQVNIHDPRPLY